MRVGSLFAGIGGFDLAFERAGFEVAWAVEIDRGCRGVLERRFPGLRLHADIRDVHAAGCLGCPGCLSAVDVLVGGFPCQDVSVAGGRAGLAGERSGLWWEFHRLIAELGPRWVVIENVPGLLSSWSPLEPPPGDPEEEEWEVEESSDFEALLTSLSELGYGWAYRILDAQWAGVPQRRRRVFVVGCAGDWRRPAEVLLEPEGCPGDPPPSRAPGPVVTALTSNGVGTCGADDNQAQGGHLVVNEAVAGTLSSKVGGSRTTDLDGHGAYVVNADVAYALKAREYKGASQRDGETTLVVNAVAFAQNQRNELVESAVSQSLSTGGGKPGRGYPAVRQGLAVRRLTPLECERLQGFPDGWTDGQSDSVRYRQLGNAVAVPVAAWIARRIRGAL